MMRTKKRRQGCRAAHFRTLSLCAIGGRAVVIAIGDPSRLTRENAVR
jgi:hypothetical protein